MCCVCQAFKAIFYFYVRTNCKKIAKQREREREKGPEIEEEGERERQREVVRAQLSVDVIKRQFRNGGHNNTPSMGTFTLPGPSPDGTVGCPNDQVNCILTRISIWNGYNL